MSQYQESASSAPWQRLAAAASIISGTFNAKRKFIFLMQDTEETRICSSREVSETPSETGYVSASTLHCCEILESGEPNTLEPEPSTADKTYDLCFTSKFWRKNIAISKDAMHIDFVLLGPLVGALPLLFQIDLYFSRSIFVVLVLYGTTGIMFLKNMINLWIYSQASRSTIKMKTMTVHLVMVVAFLAGISVMAYYLAAGDRLIRSRENLPTDTELTAATPHNYSLVWGATAAVHSCTGVLWVYAIAVPLAILIALSESIQNRDQDQFCLNHYRIKALVSLLGVGLALAEIRFRECYYLETNTFALSTFQSARTFLLISCFYLPIVLIKEIEFAKLCFPKKLDLPPAKRLLWTAINHGLTAATCGVIAAVALLAVSKL